MRIITFLVLVAAIVFSIFAIVAASVTSGSCLSIDWYVWAASALLSYFTHVALVEYVEPAVGARTAPPA